MWESLKHAVFGRASMRTFLAGVMVVIAAIFANILTPHDALALAAKWQGEDLVIDSKIYKPVPDIGNNDSRGEPAGTHVYQYVDTSTSPATAESILFAPDSTPNKSNTARFALYEYTPPSTYKLKGEKQPMTVGDAMTSSQPAGGKCTIESIGWIVCPMTEKLAQGVDWVFGVISKFMTVEPLISNKQQATYKAWEYMRNIANILLVVIFLIIIYSNITSAGISQYGIQKSLPKLVAAALLINVSFYLCAILVDLSNILGSSINQFFLNIGTSVINQSDTAFERESWKLMAEKVMSGGAIAGTGAMAGMGLIQMAGAEALLVPALLSAAFAIITAVIVLAARQALIMAFIMIAPLALIAYILPNTNKYFDKWKDTFLTLLIMFPAFAVVFGAAQLAGRVMVYSANSAAGVIFGMTVIVAPLFITPLLVKFSGGLLGKILGIVNNPNKGLIDKSRKWADKHREQRGAAVLASDKRRHKLLSATRRARYNRNRRDEEKLKRNQDAVENRYRSSRYGREATFAAKDIAHQRQLIDAEDEERWNEALNTTTLLRERELKLRVTTDKSSLQKAIMDATHTEVKAGQYTQMGPHTREMTELIQSAFDTNEQLSLNGMRKQQAEVANRKELAKRLLANKDSRIYAGGIMGHDGAESVAASAMNVELEAISKGVQDKVSMMDYFDVNSSDRQKLAMGASNVPIRDKNGNVVYTFEKDENFTRRAALKLQLKTGSVGQIREIMDSVSVVAPDGSIVSKGANFEYRSTISSEMVNSGLGAKLQQWSAKSIDDMLNGIYSEKLANAAILSGGKIKDEQFVTLAAESIDSLLSMVEKAVPGGPPISPELMAIDNREGARDAALENLQDLRYAAYRIRRDPLLNKSLTKSAKRAMDKYAEIPPGHEYTDPIEG